MGLFEKFDARGIRQRLGLNQDEFWTAIGVTQSGGSRYEAGRDMPKPVRELLRLVHVEQVDLGRPVFRGARADRTPPEEGIDALRVRACQEAAEPRRPTRPEARRLRAPRQVVSLSGW